MSDWRSKYDKSVCEGCTRKFLRSLDCVKCEVDAFARKYQASWLEEKEILFMGVNVAPAFEHPARQLPIQAKRA